MKILENPEKSQLKKALLRVAHLTFLSSKITISIISEHKENSFIIVKDGKIIKRISNKIPFKYHNLEMRLGNNHNLKIKHNEGFEAVQYFGDFEKSKAMAVVNDSGIKKVGEFGLKRMLLLNDRRVFVIYKSDEKVPSYGVVEYNESRKRITSVINPVSVKNDILELLDESVAFDEHAAANIINFSFHGEGYSETKKSPKSELIEIQKAFFGIDYKKNETIKIEPNGCIFVVTGNKGIETQIVSQGEGNKTIARFKKSNESTWRNIIVGETFESSGLRIMVNKDGVFVENIARKTLIRGSFINAAMINQAQHRQNDKAAIAYGGIDLNASKIAMSRKGSGIDIKFNQAMIIRFKKGDFTGIIPVITKITPIANIYPMLGLKEPEDKFAFAS